MNPGIVVNNLWATAHTSVLQWLVSALAAVTGFRAGPGAPAVAEGEAAQEDVLFWN